MMHAPASAFHVTPGIPLHDVHAVLPALENDPDAHGAQLAAPMPSHRKGAEVPGAHGVQLLAPAAAYLPPGHAWHRFDPLNSGTMPPGHEDVHDVLRWAENVPAAHAKQVEAPDGTGA